MRELELGHEEALGLKEEQKEAFEEKRKSLSDLKEEVLATRDVKHTTGEVKETKEVNFKEDLEDISRLFFQFTKIFGGDVLDENNLKITKAKQADRINGDGDTFFTWSRINNGEGMAFKNETDGIGFTLKPEGEKVILSITLKGQEEVVFSSSQELAESKAETGYATKYKDLIGEIKNIFDYVMKTKNNTYFKNLKDGENPNIYDRAVRYKIK